MQKHITITLQQNKIITFNQIIDVYLKHMQQIGKLNQISAYNRNFELKRFSSYCAQNNINEPSRLHRDIVVRYLESLNIVKTTKKHIMFVLEKFMNYLVDQEMLQYNIITAILKPIIYQEHPEHLTYEELNLLFRNEAKHASLKQIDRNILLLTLFTDLCLRVSEVLNLTIQDIDLTLNEIWVKRYKNKIVRISINQDLNSKFQNWFNVREQYNGKDKEWVFLSSRGNRLTPRQVRHIVGQVLKRCNLFKQKNGTHLLRQSGASLLIKNGEDPYLVQYLLGHESIESTNRFLNFKDQNIKDIVNTKKNLDKA